MSSTVTHSNTSSFYTQRSVNRYDAPTSWLLFVHFGRKSGRDNYTIQQSEQWSIVLAAVGCWRRRELVANPTTGGGGGGDGTTSALVCRRACVQAHSRFRCAVQLAQLQTTSVVSAWSWRSRANRSRLDLVLGRAWIPGRVTYRIPRATGISAEYRSALSRRPCCTHLTQSQSRRCCHKSTRVV